MKIDIAENIYAHIYL